MATATSERPGTVLNGVPWSVYLTLRELPENDRVRMTYHDGTLILMSPEYIHDGDAWQLEKVVEAAADASEIELVGALDDLAARGGRSDEGGRQGARWELLRRRQRGEDARQGAD